MHLDEPFPLEAIPSRVRHALLGEFKGRCPSVREVDQIPDKHWLRAPGIGPTALQAIRSITNAGSQQDGSHIGAPHLSDAELLRRLEQLQEDLRWLQDQLMAQMPADLKRRPHRRRRKPAAHDEADHPNHQFGWVEAPHYRRDLGHGA
jgi:hypothetical protein